MEKHLNAALVFLDAARADPEAPALTDGERRWSYGQVADLAVLSALHMSRQGAARGATVGFSGDDLLMLLATLLGTALTGARWTYVADRNRKLVLGHVTHLLTADPEEEAGSAERIVVDSSWATLPPGGKPADIGTLQGPASADDIWIIARTSGTTGTPKLVGLSHRIVSARNDANRQWFDRPGRKIAGLFPIGAPAQVSRFLSALIHRGQIVASGDPDVWLAEKLDLAFGSPAQARTTLGETVLPRKLPRFHLSGATAPETFVRHLLQSFEVVANGYGSCEAHNSMSILKTLDPSGAIRVETKVRDVAVEIVDDDGNVLPAGTEGKVRIRGKTVATGYIDNPAATAASFRDGGFYPGDIARWTEDGNFVVTGRINDQYNLGGVKLNAALIDHAMQNVEGVEDAISFLLPRPDGSEVLRAMVAVKPGHFQDTVISQIRIELLRLYGKAGVPERFMFANRLPRNPNGKPDRKACAEMVLARKQELARDRDGSPAPEPSPHGADR